jgi:hypothetical protein
LLRTYTFDGQEKRPSLPRDRAFRPRFFAVTFDLSAPCLTMGKNKKKYDLASRQEKILKRMAKPLYKKSDNSAYLVITQPFGMHPNPAERGTVDVNRLSSWISWVFGRDSVVETVYAMSTVS